MKTLLIDALIDTAEARGYTVCWHRGGPKAAWIPSRNAITLRLGMSDPATLCALAHELGHAHYGHPPGHFGAHEIQADRFAARLLIDRYTYKEAEAMYGGHAGAIAQELGVTTHLLAVWRDVYQRRQHPHLLPQADNP